MSNHPYKEHHEYKAAQKRVGHLLKGHKSGGATHGKSHGGGKSFMKRAMSEQVSVQGKKSGPRLDKYARGGAAKKKHGNHVNIAIVNPHHEPSGAAGPTPPPVAPALGGGAPVPGPMGPGGPGGPGMPPPGLPMKPPSVMKRGGKVKYARGGKVKMTGGGDSGVGRLDKVRAYGKNAKR